MAKRKKSQRTVEAPKTRPPIVSDRTAERIWVSLVLIAASLLMLLNLGNIYLWQDEAQTACISRTVLTNGVPMGYDGKNYFSQEAGAEYGKNHIWRWHTWLPFYVLGGFFAVFGESTFVCRLPFALFGIASVLMSYYVGKLLWKSRRVAVLAAVLLLLSVPYLILMRQCRYYGMTAFFTLAGLYAFIGMLEGRKRAGLWFAVSSLLLFHTHYLYYGALAATAVIHTAIFRRNRLLPVLLTSVIVFLLNLPWIIWLAGASFESSISYVVKDKVFLGGPLRQFITMSGYYLDFVRQAIFPKELLILPAVVIAVSWIRRRRFPRPHARTAEWFALMFVFSAVTVAACAKLSPYPHFRYLVVLLPVTWLLVAYMLDALMDIHWSLGIVVLLLLGFTGKIHFLLYEITHDYDGPVEGVVKYLKEHAKDSDVVVCFHEEMPLKFYAKMKVYGGLTDEDLSGAEHPKWIVLRAPTQPVEFRVSKYLEPDLLSRKYEIIPLVGYPELPFENRETPNEHLFWTVRDPALEWVKVLKRVED